MKKFEVGKTYYSKSLYGYYDKYTVIRRTPCFIVLGNGRYKIRYSERLDSEFIALGNYSMAPSLWATDEYDPSKKDEYLSDYERAMRSF